MKKEFWSNTVELILMLLSAAFVLVISFYGLTYFFDRHKMPPLEISKQTSRDINDHIDPRYNGGCYRYCGDGDFQKDPGIFKGHYDFTKDSARRVFYDKKRDEVARFLKKDLMKFPEAQVELFNLALDAAFGADFSITRRAKIMEVLYKACDSKDNSCNFTVTKQSEETIFRLKPEDLDQRLLQKVAEHLTAQEFRELFGIEKKEVGSLGKA